jgi:hypothetical protein
VCVLCDCRQQENTDSVHRHVEGSYKYIAAVDVKAGVLRQVSDMNLLRCVECTMLLLT